MGPLGVCVVVGFVAVIGVLCFKLGQKTAWDFISQNYIAIHKSAVIGPILIKREGNKKHGGWKNDKNKSNRAHKKASK